MLIGVHVDADGSGIGVHGPVGMGTMLPQTVTWPAVPVADTPVTKTTAVPEAVTVPT